MNSLRSDRAAHCLWGRQQGLSQGPDSPWRLQWPQPARRQPGWPGIAQPWSWLADAREGGSTCTFPGSTSLWCSPCTRWQCCRWCRSSCCQRDARTDSHSLLCCNCLAGTLDTPVGSSSARRSVSMDKQKPAQDFKCKSGDRGYRWKGERQFAKEPQNNVKTFPVYKLQPHFNKMSMRKKMHLRY